MEIKDIKDDKFLKSMKDKELKDLASKIRLFLLENISKTGGHLSSNLGTVELIIALHKSFDFDIDKVLFDVGHQAYTHKILTGRASKFDTLSKIDGLSPFLSSDESKYDIFESGHSSTSLSTAMGLAKARDDNKEKFNIVCVIGDGSISNGVSFEALNNISTLKEKVIIVLNDNDMAINKNVGAMAKGLNRIRTSKFYGYIKLQIISFFSKFKNGYKFINFCHRIVHRITLLFRTDCIFDNFNVSYLGPVDGHNFKKLDKAFECAKRFNGPILVHVKTKKGKGYKFAEEDKIGKFHGVSPFDVNTGELNSTTKNYSYFYGKVVYDILKENKDSYLISSAMVTNSSLIDCFEDFKSQCIDVGIAEEHSISFANGLALANKYPIVSLYSTFMQRGYDEIVHDLARINSNVLFLVDHAGLVSKDGKTHQGNLDVSFLYPLENVIIAMPSSTKYIRSTVNKLFNYNGLKFIRYPKLNAIEENDVEIELFKSILVKYDKNNKYSLICVGDSINKMKELFKNEDINIIDPLFLKPLDYDTLDKLINTRVFIYDNTSVYQGFASEVYTYLTNKNTKVKCFTLPNKFIKHGDYNDLLKYLNLDEDNIFNIIEEIIHG